MSGMITRMNEATAFAALFGVPCVTILVACWRDASSVFALHPAANAVANLICMPVALFIMLERKKAKTRASRVLMTKLHLGLHATAALLQTVAGIAVFRVKQMHGKRHLTSVHSWAAITTVLLFVLNIFQGLLLTFEKKPSNWQWKDETHGLVGTLVYIGSAGTMVCGLYSGSWGGTLLGRDSQLHLSIVITLAHLVLLGKAIIASPSRRQSSPPNADKHE